MDTDANHTDAHLYDDDQDEIVPIPAPNAPKKNTEIAPINAELEDNTPKCSKVEIWQALLDLVPRWNEWIVLGYKFW